MTAKVPVTKANFILPDGYTFKRHLGSGAYGTVCACIEDKTGEEVAVKKISKVFDRKIITKRTLREIKLLRHFQGHENITCILDIFKLGGDDFNEVYLVQELMEADMHQIIRSHQKLTNAHFQYFIYQILRGLKYIHSAQVLHRDLKPGNLLVNADCELKICDFGLARGLAEPRNNGDDNGALMTEYVATRWYRAPEIMLSFQNYNQAIDVWSVGCIFAELLGGKVLFPGKDYVHQMSLIINVLGSPSEETLVRIGSPRAQDWIRNMPKREKVPFVKIYPDADPQALDLLERMLDFDPASRITVEKALNHPYLAVYHDPQDEPSHVPMDFSFEAVEAIDDMRKMIVEEINTYPFPTRTSLHRSNSTSLQKSVKKTDDKKTDEDYTARAKAVDPQLLNDEIKKMSIDSADLEKELVAGVVKAAAVS